VALTLAGAPTPSRAQDTATPAATPAVFPTTAVVYLTVANGGERADRLLGGETTAARAVELAGGMLGMQPRPEGIEIPAGETVAFDPSGDQVMLVDLMAALTDGATYDLLLRFEIAGEVTVPVQVRAQAEAKADAPAPEPVTAGDLTISDAWTRPALALLGAASGATPSAVGLDTPVTTEDLSVMLTADGVTAGPRDLTVIVADASGAPVTDATVTVRVRSLEMDHGVSTRETAVTEPGHYLAERVPLGMGGDWAAEVTVERPGTESVVVAFVVTLDGPTH